MNYKDEYKIWLESNYITKKDKEELLSIASDEKEIEDRFYKKLDFGTAGLRGVMGIGTNRLNIYTIRTTTQGIANFILNTCDNDEKKVVIAYDPRINSKEFAKEAALCLCANGIKVYLFDDLRPTPELSFAIMRLECIIGINITASHNPKEYNGYKVYYSDGAQITHPIDDLIISEVNKINDFSNCKYIKEEEAIDRGLLEIIGKEIDDEYILELKKLIKHDSLIRKWQEKIKIVYTPLNGAGNILVRRILNEIGFSNVYVVKEQELPDGNFPTCKYPNPEQPAVFEKALELAKEIDADLIIATDPDSDRLGAYVKDKDNTYHRLTGNMIGSILTDFVLDSKSKENGMLNSSYVVKTIVSTNMIDAICENYNTKVIEVLTGFKYIGEVIKNNENTNNIFEFGFEESYGYLIGTHAKDKDAVVSAMKLAEAVAYNMEKGLTLYDVLNKLYDKYGYYLDDSFSIELKGIDGNIKINKIMDYLRQNPLKDIGGFKVLKIRDYKIKTINNLIDNTKSEIILPMSNVIYYELDDKAWLCIRPSGTEPKIKIYIGVVSNNMDNAYKSKVIIEEAISSIINNI